MAVHSVTRTIENLTLTFVAEFDAPPERVWQVWADPRQLERWWGPPMWPATFLEHDLALQGRCRYVMTGPSGERSFGWWRILGVDAPRSLEIEDGFASESGAPNPDFPTTRMAVLLEAQDEGSRMTVSSIFPSAEAMEMILGMGAEEGMTLALDQIDALLAE